MANNKVVHRPFKTVNTKTGVVTTTHFENTASDVIIDNDTGVRLPAVLKYHDDRIAKLEETGGGGGGTPTSQSLKDLTDVDMTTQPSNGEVLGFDGTKWKPTEIQQPEVITELKRLDDVDGTITPTDGNILGYKENKWSPIEFPEPVVKLSKLEDVNPDVTPTTGDVLTYDGSKWSPTELPPVEAITQLSKLTDVDGTKVPINGDVLGFDGAKWKPVVINASGPSAQVGGYRSVATIADRDKIPANERQEGMLCGVLQNDTVYQLKGGIDNAFWVIFATGAGGATNAADMAYQPSGTLTGTNVQVAVDELESKKADIQNVYTQAEVDSKLLSHTHDYTKLTNKPDLSSLHTHVNKVTLDKFTEAAGKLVWAGKTIGDMVAAMYDADNDGIVDKSKTLDGLTTTINMLNYTAGLTGNIQAQINALSSGTQFKGQFTTWAQMVASIPTPQKGYWVFVETDETKNNAKTQYYHDGTNWIYGGGATTVPAATIDALGGIKLNGVLGNPASTSDIPLLKDSGVTPGTYNSANVTIGADGRVTFAESGTNTHINDDITSDTETWSSTKMNDELSNKSNKDHTHSQLHDPNMIGNVKVNMSTLANKRVIGYDATSGEATWMDSSGGRVYVGSKMITGDFRLVAGAYTSLFIDDAAKTITINSTAGGGSAVPTLTEITHTETIESGASALVNLDAAFDKYDIRTIEASNTGNSTIDIQVFDSVGDNQRRIYQSNKESYTYDIVNVPCHDKDGTKQLHLKLTNYGSTQTSVSLTITTTNLI
ncbi:hypothetical protein D1872_37280 [compost metagenome]